MSALRFSTSAASLRFPSRFDPFLFSDDRHLRLQSGDQWHHVVALHKERDLILGHFAFVMQNGIALSPARASFGVFQFDPGLSTADLVAFVQHIESFCLELGARAIRLVCAPDLYQSRAAVRNTIFLSCGYRIADAATSCLISTEVPFEEGLDTWERRKLRQAVQAGIDVRRVMGPEEEEVYRFIATCRAERDQALSRNWEQLRTAADIFRQEFLFFAATLDETMVAASVAIRINTDVLYNFYSAHPRSQDALSPVVLLMRELHSHATQQKMRWLDLGTSSLNGMPNAALLDFKLRLGVTPSMKLTFEKSLTSA